MIIYFNPECSKCKQALNLLKQQHCKLDIRNYLNDPPTNLELKHLLQKLQCKAIDIVRKKEPLFIQNYEGKSFSDQEWLEILCKNPILIERPIVINVNKAIVGRPPHLVLDII